MSNSKTTFTPFIEESRKRWGTELKDGQSLNLEQVKAGAFLRMADSLEEIAEDRKELLEEIERLERQNEYLRKRRDYYQRKYEYMSRSRASYKGLYYSLKNGNGS